MAKILPLAIAIMLIVASGCSKDTVNNASKDVQHDVNVVAKDVKPKAQELDLGARVTAALTANANLPKTIRVDASPTGVRLKGTVTTATQKHLAGEVAKQTLAPTDTVDNELVVKAK